MAQVITERYLQGALAKSAKAIRSGPGSEICEECGGIIPMERREAMPGAIRCVMCQTEFEKYQEDTF